MRDSLERERRLDEVVADYLEAAEAGRAPDPDLLLARHPDLADELAAFLADEARFSSFVSPLRPARELTPTPTLTTYRDDVTTGAACGDYELLEEIARGGMGVVFRARQKSLNRVVAVKMILGGHLAAKEDMHRFRFEAQAVADLDHPNIVPIYDVGEWRTDQTSVPFFSMKLIEGGSLAQHRGLFVNRPRDAVRLMIDVSRAVDHAHQRGILHRDLKPGNILLAPAAGWDEGRARPEAGAKPYVTDFGLAKRLGSSSVTATGAVVGTPSYMAPEQASGRKAALTTAADVYSLGTILYELTTGRPPFKSDIPLETLVQVIEQEPASPRSLNSQVNYDLSTIILKCLEKSPANRYASAAALADDLQRYLDGEAIQARPPKALERVVRWCRRSPVVALSVAFATVTLLAATGVSLGLYFREADHAASLRAEKEQTQAALVEVERQEKEARRHADDSAANFQDAHAVVNDFTVRISDELAQVPAMQPLRKELLAAALNYYQKFLARRGDEPELKSDLANATFSAARITSAIGSKAEAVTLYQKALELFEGLARTHPGDPIHESDVGHCLHNLAALQSVLGQQDAARMNRQRELEIVERLARTYPQDEYRFHDLASCLHNLAVEDRDRGFFEESLRQYDRAATLWEQLVCARPKVSMFQENLALCLNNSGVLLSQLGEATAARHRYESALAIREKLVQESPRNADRLLGLAASLHDLGLLHDRIKEADVALDYLQRALDIRERLAAENPSVTTYQADLAGSLADLGHAARDRKKLGDALTYFQRALAIYQKLADRDPNVLHYQNDVALTHFHIAGVLADNRQHKDAERALGRAHDIQAKVVAADPDRLDYRHDLGMTLGHLGLARARLDQFDPAIVALNEAIDQAKLVFGKAPQVPRHRTSLSSHYGTLAEIYRKVGRAADSARVLRMKQELWPKRPDMLYAVACDLAATARVAPKADQPGYLDEAMAALRQAVAAGLRDREKLQNDPRLAELRQRPDFTSLLKSSP